MGGTPRREEGEGSGADDLLDGEFGLEAGTLYAVAISEGGGGILAKVVVAWEKRAPLPSSLQW